MKRSGDTPEGQPEVKTRRVLKDLAFYGSPSTDRGAENAFFAVMGGMGDNSLLRHVNSFLPGLTIANFTNMHTAAKLGYVDVLKYHIEFNDTPTLSLSAIARSAMEYQTRRSIEFIINSTMTKVFGNGDVSAEAFEHSLMIPFLVDIVHRPYFYSPRCLEYISRKFATSLHLITDIPAKLLTRIIDHETIDVQIWYAENTPIGHTVMGSLYLANTPIKYIGMIPDFPDESFSFASVWGPDGSVRPTSNKECDIYIRLCERFPQFMPGWFPLATAFKYNNTRAAAAIIKHGDKDHFRAYVNFFRRPEKKGMELSVEAYEPETTILIEEELGIKNVTRVRLLYDMENTEHVLHRSIPPDTYHLFTALQVNRIGDAKAIVRLGNPVFLSQCMCRRLRTVFPDSNAAWYGFGTADVWIRLERRANEYRQVQS